MRVLIDSTFIKIVWSVCFHFTRCCYTSYKYNSKKNYYYHYDDQLNVFIAIVVVVAFYYIN